MPKISLTTRALPMYVLAAAGAPLLLACSSAQAQSTADIKSLLAAAKPGKVVQLEAKTYAAGDLIVPPGVTLRGAGYQKTTIDATGFKNGITIGVGAKSQIQDLGVRGANECGVLVRGASGVTLSRLNISGNLTGVLLADVQNGRFENLLITQNRTGAILTGTSGSSLVNCSLVDNPALGLTMARNSSLAVFNNLVVNSPTALYLASSNQKLTLDHNFYIASYFGKMEGEVARTTLVGWQRLTGLDQASISLPLTFANAAAGDYRPTNALKWAPNLAVTSNWGATTLAGVAAPKMDIEGKPRNGAPDLGIYETNLSTARQPDGFLEIKNSLGTKSAGVYDAAGINVGMFFQNLPLPRGRHPFYLPARDNQNRPIPAGAYEVRVAESQLSNKYLGLVGNFATSANQLDNSSWPEEMFAFDAQDRLYIAQNSFENGMGVRAFDAAYQKPRWMMPGGGGTVGVATDEQYLYYLQRQSDKFNLRKIHLETGVMTGITPTAGNLILDKPFSPETKGLAHLNKSLFISDPGTGQIYKADAANPTFAAWASVPRVRSLVADAKQGVLWAIAEQDSIVAIDPATGKITPAGKPVPGATDLGASNGQLAVLSPETGKIHIFDSSDPVNLKATRTIGTGDGPFGQQRPDRFWFQTAPRSEKTKTHVAINSQGEVAVVDGIRISFWAANGSLKRQGMGFWGQHNYKGKLAGDDDVRFWGISGDYSIKMDAKSGKWSPDRKWQLPAYDFEGRSPRHFFTTGGKDFAVYEIAVGDPAKQPEGKLALLKIAKEAKKPAYLVTRLDEKEAVPVTLYYHSTEKETLLRGLDTNRDGMIDHQDTFEEIRTAEGGKVALPRDRYGSMPREGGHLVFTNRPSAASIGIIVHMRGLDATGTYPNYDFANPEIIPCTVDGKTANFISPYDYKTKEVANSAVQVAELSDGGYASSMAIKSSGGTGLANGAGTDIAGFSKDGRLRWIFKLNTVQGSQGVQSIPQYKLVMGMTSTQCDYMVMNEDGLGMGALPMPQEAQWHGMWSDHAQQQQVWVGNDGKPYYILGDYAANGYHWFQITGTEKTVASRFPVQIGEPSATLLAALPELVPEIPAVPPVTKILVKRLEKPMAIDGDLAKWRTLAPVALITPDTGTANIVGPQDCSAVLRMAYEGQNLYVQTIVFDDKVTFHQPLDKMYQQDGVEMGINGFMQGFKFNVANTTDSGPTVFRNKFVVASADRNFSNEMLPRSIKVYEDTSLISERQYIEAIYGVDLSKSRAIVTEYKIPLTPEVGLDGDPKLVTVAPGQTFWTGFFINDNDIPGGDIQKYLAWPATYGTFAVKEAGALATFE